MDNLLKRLIRPALVGLGRRRERKHFSRRPVIIGACPRSGTTLLLSILDAHPHIYSIQKQTYAFTRWDSDGRPTRLDRLYRQLLVHRIPRTATRWCEKTPKNIQSFGRILDWSEGEARLIHMVRDGRDVVTSRHPKHDPHHYWVPVRRWVSDVALGLELAEHSCVHTVRYEDLIADYEGQLERLMEFLDEPVVPEVIDWASHTSLRRSIHWAKPLESIHARAVGRWSRPEHRRVVGEFMSDPEALKLMERLGYGL